MTQQESTLIMDDRPMKKTIRRKKTDVNVVLVNNNVYWLEESYLNNNKSKFQNEWERSKELWNSQQKIKKTYVKNTKTVVPFRKGNSKNSPIDYTKAYKYSTHCLANKWFEDKPYLYFVTIDDDKNEDFYNLKHLGCIYCKLYSFSKNINESDFNTSLICKVKADTLTAHELSSHHLKATGYERADSKNSPEMQVVT